MRDEPPPSPGPEVFEVSGLPPEQAVHRLIRNRFQLDCLTTTIADISYNDHPRLRVTNSFPQSSMT